MSTFKKFMEGGKLFGNAAARVTNAELQSVYQELKSQIGDLFSRFESTKTLQSKQDHGDIDILVLAEPNVNIKDIVISSDCDGKVRVSKCKVLAEVPKNPQMANSFQCIFQCTMSGF